MPRCARSPERLLVVAAALALGGCTTEGSIGRVREHVEVDPGKLDVLFVIDNSDSMGDEQALYLPILIRELESLPGGLPSLHVGVVSTDLGIDPFAAESCSGRGDGGALQNAPRLAGCAPPEGAFLADEIGPSGRIRNYTGSLEEAFLCIASLGNLGCGIEQPLEAMKRALDGSISKNVGFLRDDAFLAVIILTDEDDCSAAQPDPLFDPSAALDTPTSIVGPFASFRCTRFGVACDGHPVNTVGAHAGCAPRADSYVRHPDEYVEFLRTIKDPAALFVTVVAGAPSPVVVETTVTGSLKLTPSCDGALGVADPAVRLAYFAASFPHHAVSSICDGEGAAAAFSLGGDVRQLILRYEQDRRGDLDISYGCAAAPRPAAAPPLASFVLALLTAWGTRTSRRRGTAPTTPPRCAPRRRR